MLYPPLFLNIFTSPIDPPPPSPPLPLRAHSPEEKASEDMELMAPCSFCTVRFTSLSLRDGHRMMPCPRQMRLSVVEHTPISSAASCKLEVGREGGGEGGSLGVGTEKLVRLLCLVMGTTTT